MGGLLGTMIGPPTQADDLLQQIAALSQAPNPDLEAAKQQAAQAQQAYGSAAAQPPPQLDPASQFIPSLLGNVASVLSGNQNYAQNAQDEIKTKKSDLLKARADNLQALRDVYSQKAEEAQKLGDLDATEKYRVKLETLSKTHEQLLHNQRLDATARENALDREAELRKAQIAANAKGAGGSTGPGSDWGPDEYDAAVESVVNGETTLNTYPIRVRGQINKQIKAQGRSIMPPIARKAIEALGGASTVVDELEALSLQVNTAGPGMARFAQGAKNWLGATSQSDVAAQGLASSRAGLSGNLARAISAERGVLTDADLRRALRLLPGLWDSKEVASSQIARLRRFIEAKQNLVKYAHTTEGGGAKIMKAQNELRAAARKGDQAAIRSIIAEYPDLDEDGLTQEILDARKRSSTENATAKSLKGKK